MQLFTEPFLITNRGGPGGGTETLGLLLYRQGFTVAQFRLRLGDRLHDGGAGDRDLASQSLAGERNRNEIARPVSICAASLSLHAVADAAGDDLAVSALDDGRCSRPCPTTAFSAPASSCCRTTISSRTSHNLQRDTDFIRAIVISVCVALTYTFLSVLLTSMAGWALARYQFFGKGRSSAIILGTITLPYSSSSSRNSSWWRATSISPTPGSR